MSDRIELRGLQVMAYCGVLPEERERRQPFAVDLDVECDLAAAGRTDALDDTIDYGALGAGVAAIAADERFGLLERFAQRIAESVLAVPKVDAVTVRVRKLRPPVPQHLDTSGVRIRRARG
jgi:dihydroneopterin aldolase